MLTYVSMNIKELRARLGVSQDKLAILIGVAPYTVRRWEAGKNRPSPLAQAKLDDLEGKLAEGKR